jgi:hypothetical protein
MPADACSEMGQAELLEIARCGWVHAMMSFDEPHQTFVCHGRWKAERIGLKRVPRVDAIGPDHAPSLDLEVIVADPPEHTLFHRRVP